MSPVVVEAHRLGSLDSVLEHLSVVEQPGTFSLSHGE